MRPRKQNRLDRVQQAITALPIRKKVLDEAFAFFVAFGELPDEQYIADAVARRALGEDVDRQPLEVRESLFHEAVFGAGFEQRVARAAIAVEVAHDGKVTDPRFAARHGIPEHGSIGMHVLGYPEKWATPPYVEQAHRLFARYRSVRARIDHGDSDWFEPFANALLAFYAEDEMPDEGLLRDYVLAEVEMEALQRHKKGNDVAELMAALDAAAKAATDEREAAVLEVVAVHGPNRQRR